jgi:hypothetical protein
MVRIPKALDRKRLDPYLGLLESGSTRDFGESARLIFREAQNAVLLFDYLIPNRIKLESLNCHP